MIVQPDVALAQRKAEFAAQQPVTPSMPLDISSTPDDTLADQPTDTPAPPRRKTRSYGSVQIDPQRAMSDLSQIADEIIVRLTSVPGADVRITVEIESVHDEGFDDATVRTISENSRTLNFNSHDFED